MQRKTLLCKVMKKMYIPSCNRLQICRQPIPWSAAPWDFWWAQLCTDGSRKVIKSYQFGQQSHTQGMWLHLMSYVPVHNCLSYKCMNEYIKCTRQYLLWVWPVGVLHVYQLPLLCSLNYIYFSYFWLWWWWCMVTIIYSYTAQRQILLLVLYNADMKLYTDYFSHTQTFTRQPL